MNRWIFMPLFLLFFAGMPVGLAMSQNVPTQSVFQLAVLLISLSAFGLMIGMFWLSHLMPRDTVTMKLSSMLRWHKTIGYAASAFFMVHPVLMIARRFWVQESRPLDNLVLMLRSPLLRPAIVAWVLLALMVALAFFRKHFRYMRFRYLHGVLAIAFVGFSTWHVVVVGRHSDPTMSIFWIMFAGAAVGSLLILDLNRWRWRSEGGVHESA